MINWENYKYLPPTMKPNKIKIPVNNIGFNEEGIKEFNELYNYCLEKQRSGEFHEMVLTKSKGICIKPGVLRGACWSLSATTTIIELLIRNTDANYYRFIVGYRKNESKGFSGRRAFQMYTAALKQDGVDLADLAIDNGKEVKATIPSPKIELVSAIPERTYYNAHHLDINSAFNAGMIEKYPILEKSVRRMYEKRKEKPIYKDVLNMTQGFMQSELVGYKYSHISKAGYVYTNRRIDELTQLLLDSGRRVLSYNTDGIWYQGEIYHDENEGSDIGQWKHDYVDCKVRFKSKGAYEFEGTVVKTGEKVYKPVVRGQSTYERQVPRKDWKWGDIFKGATVEYKFIEGMGLISYVDD